MKKLMSKEIKNINYKTLFLFTSIIIAIPSIIYLIQNKTLFNFTEYFTFFLHKPNEFKESLLGATIFGTTLILLIYFYFKIIKDSTKEFKNIRQILIYVLLISIIFGIAVPFTTSDIFYYIGTGWIDSHYNENPYYTVVREVRMEHPNDEILQKTGVYEGRIVVYGPLWALICRILSFLSFGNVTLGVYIFKIAAIGMHVLNTFLVYKITKKKKFALLYGLNPYMLFEMITNVHNDIYLVTFILLALYMLFKKKNIILTIIFMALATCVKYISLLLIPFITLYYLKDKKIQQKILYCFIFALLFIIIVCLIYVPYIKDERIFTSAILLNAYYRESLMMFLTYLAKTINLNIVKYIKPIFLVIFALIFAGGIISIFFKQKENRKNIIRKYNNTLLAFFLFGTGYVCPWYLSWLTPTMFWLKGKTIKNILYFQFAYELVTLINFATFCESFVIGIFYPPIILCIVIIFNIISKYKKEKIQLCKE